jgi:phosphatidylserine decarboxylase
MGLIKFGSRVDVLIPAAANLKVKTGSRVKGGSTVLAVLPENVVETETVAVAVVA